MLEILLIFQSTLPIQVLPHDMSIDAKISIGALTSISRGQVNFNLDL